MRLNPAELLKELREETLPLVPLARQALERARASLKPEDVATVRELLHKVAGTAAPIGLPQLSRLARFGEELAVLVLSGDAKTNDATLTLLGRILDALDAELSSSNAPERAPASAAEPPSPTRQSPAPRPPAAPSNRAQVLLADGDAVSVKLFSKVLVDNGFELVTFKAADAVAPIEEGLGDVLLLDVSAGLTEAAKALASLAKSRRLPVVALCKLPRTHASLIAFAAEVDEFLTKPVATDVLVAKVRIHAERRRAVRAARARAPTAISPVVRSPTPPVLVVDDSRVIRGLVREFLAESKVEVIEAEDGRAALSLLQGLDRLPAAAVIDIQMPLLNGLELTRALRAEPRLAALPVVLLSAQEDPESQRSAVAAGANAYLVKEKFDAPELRRALRKAGMTISEPV